MPAAFMRLTAAPLRAPLLQHAITGFPSFFNASICLSSWSSGMFFDPLTCPVAYSPGVRTSMIRAPLFTSSLKSVFFPNNTLKIPFGIIFPQNSVVRSLPGCNLSYPTPETSIHTQSPQRADSKNTPLYNTFF